MTNEEKARKIIGETCKKENCLQCGGRYSAEEGGCTEFQRIVEMAKWKDEQIISSLPQIITCVYQGITQCAPDKVIIKEITNLIKKTENYEEIENDSPELE